MKNDNYEEWMDRYYTGTASAKEILILKSEGHVSEEDELYMLALQAERKITLPLQFEDFVKKQEAPKVVELVYPNHSVRKFAAAAAVIAVVLISYIFFHWQQVTNMAANGSAKTQWVRPDSNQVADNNLFLADKTKDTSQQALPGTLLHKRISLRQKPGKKFFAVVKKEQPDAAPWLVLVNGKPITDSTEAIAITSQSMALFSENISRTVKELKQITQLKIKL